MNLRRIIIGITVLLLVLSFQGVSLAEPTKAESRLVEAITAFVKTQEDLQRNLPGVTDAAGTVKALDRWTKATENFGQAMMDLAKEQPDIVSARTPPPELVPAFRTLSEAKKKHAGLARTMAALVERFDSDPEVVRSFSGLQRALDDLSKLNPVAPAPNTPEETAKVLLREILAIDAAKDMLALKHKLKTESPVTWEQVRSNLPPTSRLAALNEPRDILGNPIMIQPVDLSPKFSDETKAFLRTKTTVDLANPPWKRFVEPAAK